MSRVGSIALKDLIPVIDKAVAAATNDQVKKSLDSSGAAISNWHIIGRQLQNIDPAAAHAFSARVAEQISQAGAKVEPVTLMMGHGRAVAGFFPVDQLNKIQL